MNGQQTDGELGQIKQNGHFLGPSPFTGRCLKAPGNQLKQIPLIFADKTTDLISKGLTSFGSQLPYKVIYMGFRPVSNMKAIKHYAQSKHQKFVNQSSLYSKNKLKRFEFLHSQEPQKYFPIRPSEYRLFTGTNPTWKGDHIKFSSEFQGGNLDLAIHVGPSQYDLLLRIDSNTKGHTSWYLFKVFDIKKKKKIRFNIINFTKNNLLYLEGMKPYVFRSSKKVWIQGGTDVEFKNKAVRYFTQKDKTILSKCLSFTYQFEDLEEEVYFAYSIPYSYSYLLGQLQSLQMKYSQCIKIDYDNQTTGGLPLPLVTITNFNKQNQKQSHLIIGRLHPGQSQGSWMIGGLMKYLCSPQANYIRDRVIFKIIPMVNIDGVILGNFRTGIAGRDLNRMFNKPQLYSQTKLIDNIAKQFKPQVFLDFHGHSGKKNVFIYGPQYKIQQRDFLVSRLYPKLISRKTEAFRYYSCVFRINQFKLNTGRALMFFQHKTRFVFTIQASTHAYVHAQQKVVLSSQKYSQIGSKIAQSLQQFTKILMKLPKRLQVQASKQSLINSSTKQLPKNRNKQQDFGYFKIYQDLNIDNSSSSLQMVMERQLIKQILQSQKQMRQSHRKIDIDQDSDCEDEDQDYTDLELKKIQTSLNCNKTDSIESILSLKTKHKQPKPPNISIQSNKPHENKNKNKKFNTLDIPPKKQPNKDLIMSKQLIKNTQSPPIKLRKRNSQNKRQVSETQLSQRINRKQYFNNKYLKLKMQQNEQSQRLRKINVWKSTQLNNFNDLETIVTVRNNDLERNKSPNQFYFQGPPELQSDSIRRRLPKMKSQTKKGPPILLIRKSFLPTVQLKNRSKSHILQSSNDPQRQKSLINQIIQIHQRKKRNNPTKMNRKMKIIFHQQ